VYASVDFDRRPDLGPVALGGHAAEPALVGPVVGLDLDRAELVGHDDRQVGVLGAVRAGQGRSDVLAGPGDAADEGK
jgi:hypothetical protein